MGTPGRSSRGFRDTDHEVTAARRERRPNAQTGRQLVVVQTRECPRYILRQVHGLTTRRDGHRICSGPYLPAWPVLGAAARAAAGLADLRGFAPIQAHCSAGRSGNQWARAVTPPRPSPAHTSPQSVERGIPSQRADRERNSESSLRPGCLR